MGVASGTRPRPSSALLQHVELNMCVLLCPLVHCWVYVVWCWLSPHFEERYCMCVCVSCAEDVYVPVP